LEIDAVENPVKQNKNKNKKKERKKKFIPFTLRRKHQNIQI
jgi:hypothetical protein